MRRESNLTRKQLVHGIYKIWKAVQHSPDVYEYTSEEAQRACMVTNDIYGMLDDLLVEKDGIEDEIYNPELMEEIKNLKEEEEHIQKVCFRHFRKMDLKEEV
jgi:hypothetical protein